MNTGIALERAANEFRKFLAIDGFGGLEQAPQRKHDFEIAV